MEWNEKLQIIIDYVENHLQRKQEPIDPQEIAKIAGCSENAELRQAAIYVEAGAKSVLPFDGEKHSRIPQEWEALYENTGFLEGLPKGRYLFPADFYG